MTRPGIYITNTLYTHKFNFSLKYSITYTILLIHINNYLLQHKYHNCLLLKLNLFFKYTKEIDFQDAKGALIEMKKSSYSYQRTSCLTAFYDALGVLTH